jgi:hypothetical protein
MDPNATLTEIRALVDANHHVVMDADRLAELISALDEWITGGGFLPTPWQH